MFNPLSAQAVIADLSVEIPEGGHYDAGDRVPLTLLIVDEEGNELRIDQFEDNGLRVLELWVSGPRQDYLSVGQYIEFVILSTRNGFNENAGFDPESGEIEITLPRNNLVGGTYSAIFEIERRHENRTYNIFPYVDFQVGQDRETITQSIRYLNCTSEECHEAPSYHETEDLTNCIICHTHDYRYPWDDIMHSLREHQNNNVEDCTDCHRANADIDEYGFTACTSCHADRGHGHQYNTCNNCHWGEIYRWHNEFSPTGPRSFDLISPENREQVIGQPVRFEWEESGNNDEGDIISYELRLGLDSRFRNYISFDAGENTSIEIEGIDYNRNYYWRIRASDLNQLTRNSGQNWRFSVAVPGQTLNLREGWNLTSLNTSPVEEFWLREDGPDVELLIELLRIDEENLPVEIVKDEQGRFYVPGFEFNNIPFWDLTDGYRIKTTSELEVTVEGDLIPADTDIHLGAGWNLIAYYPVYELSAEAPNFDVLSPIIEHVQIAKDGEGNFLIPEQDFSNMPDWSPGNAYQVYVGEDVVLNYPNENNALTGHKLVEKEKKEKLHWKKPESTDQNMSLLIKDIDGLITEKGDQIAVMNYKGKITGVGIIDEKGQCGISVWGDDKSTELIDGMKTGERLKLKYWDADKNAENKVKVISDKILKYKKDDFIAAEISVESQTQDGFFVSPAYQNPFNAVTRIDYQLPEKANLKITVSDVSGKTIAILLDGRQETGSYQTVWNAVDSPSGLYFVRLDAGIYNHVQKVMLLK